MNSHRDFFKELGLRPFINAAGTYTVLTASLMHPEVLEAMKTVAKYFVRLDELHDAIGKRIANLVSSEAAMVTSGASAALLLGTAACLTGKDSTLIKQLPRLAGPKSEVIIQTSHRFDYDHAVHLCGAGLVEVNSTAALEKAVNPKTAMMLFLNDAAPRGTISAEQFVALGKKHGIPTLIDCAADVPPTENLWKYTRMGFDLVAFSGGKGLRGPQNAGLLLGKKELIEAARLNSSPHDVTIGRGLKVSKEMMIGMMVALEIYLQRDPQAEWREWEHRANIILKSMERFDAVQAAMIIPPIANQVPTVSLQWSRDVVALTAEAVRRQLREGNPAIEIIPETTPDAVILQKIFIGVWQLQTGEAELVAARLTEIFEQAARQPS